MDAYQSEKYNLAIWDAVSYIAARHGKTCSGLALCCGLDATIFNRSKRRSVHGQPRWLSSETIAKVLCYANMRPTQFAQIVELFLDKDTPLMP